MGFDEAVRDDALRIGGDLALDVFKVWRRDLDCLDALILLAIQLGNLDSRLLAPPLRSQYGASYPPDHLRPPAHVDVVALRLRLREAACRRRVNNLSRRDKCEISSEGMVVITLRQVEASGRTAILEAVYGILRTAYRDLDDLAFFSLAPLPPLKVAEPPPIRTAGAVAGRYALHLLGELSGSVGDFVDALILLAVMQENRRQEAVHPARVGSVAAGLA